MESNTNNAARLVALAIRDRRGTQRELELRKLVREMNNNPVFRDEVDNVANGLGVKLISADFGHDLIVVPDDVDSPFAPSFSDIKSINGRDSQAEFMLVTLGIVSSYFPSSDLLYDSSRAGEEGRKMEHLINDIRDLCARLKESNPDMTGQLNRMVDNISKMPAFDPAKGMDKSKNTGGYLVSIIHPVLNYYIDIGFLKKYEDSQGEHFLIQSRFEQHLREFGLIELDKIVSLSQQETEVTENNTSEVDL